MSSADPATPGRRRAVRVVLSDAAGRVLLLHLHEPQHPQQGDCWELPGGGIVDGEDITTAARRELLEETGLDIAPAAIAAARWTRSVTFMHAGCRRTQDEQIVAATIIQQAPLIDPTALDEAESETYLGYRWWSVRETETSEGTRFFPSSLPQQIRAFLTGVTISEPFERFS